MVISCVNNVHKAIIGRMLDQDEQPSVTVRRESLRAAILDAAEARVTASGLADLGVREIAREAGCSSGMVYKLFANHDDLVLAVNARTLAALSDAIARHLHGIDDPARAICAMADAYLDFASANTPRWDALFAHRMTGGAALPAWYADQRDALFNGLATMTGAGGGFARTLFSAVHGVVALGLQQKVGQVAPDALRHELQTLIEVITRGLFTGRPIEPQAGFPR